MGLFRSNGANHSGMKLGKQAARFDARVPVLARYMADSLPPPAVSADWTSKVPSYTMASNDTCGDCTIAGKAHAITQWTTYTRDAPVVWTDQQVTSEYFRLSGGQDTGLVEVDVLNDWVNTGEYGDKLDGYASLNPKDPDDLRYSIEWFGNAYLGLALPLSAQKQDIWSTPWYGSRFNGAPGSWGGHCVIAVSYTPDHVTLVTWGMLKLCTWDFLASYLDESYALLNNDWIEATGMTPSGLNLDQLRSDMAAIKG